MSEPLIAITKPERTTHTQGPWRNTAEYGAKPGEPLRFCHFLISNSDNDWIASTWANNPNASADAALIAQAPALLAHAEKSLRWMIAERDCLYDGVTNHHGEYTDDEDRMAVEQYDRDIDELRALIAAARGEV